MVSILPYAASICGSICYGVATVLQQVGAKQSENIKNINPLNLIKLIKQGPYFFGLFLDFIGWLFFLVAVRSLPLFLVQSFIALSIFVSALVDKYWLNHKILKSEKLSILFVVIGVVLLSYTALPSRALPTSNLFKWTIVLTPIGIALIAAALIKINKSNLVNSTIAVLAGLAFGGTSIVTRLIVFNQITKQPIQLGLAIALIVFGILAIVLLAVALQRERVNKVNSLVLAAEVLVPSIIGIMFLGDKVRNDLWFVMLIGLSLVFIGALFTSSLAKSRHIQ